MKKYLLSALALPLLFACSSEDYLDQKATDNDQFAGIEKVDATFSMADSPSMRFATDWTTEEDDVWGFAWMGDGTVVTNTNGFAKQNHNLIQTDGIFTPQTSIYVGDYYLYRPYDEETKSPQAINFTSLEEQPLAEGLASSGAAWKGLAKSAINIGDKFTNVTTAGTTDLAGKTWDKAGIKQHYKINGAVFSNQTGLDLTYTKNNVEAPAGGMHITGATDIDYTIAAGTKIGAADIYEAKVQLAGAAKSFTYAPKNEPVNGGAHSGDFWANKSDLNTNGIAATTTNDAFTWATGTGYDEITLKAADENGISTETADNKGWFWFNSLPVTQGNATTSTAVKTTLSTSYGVVTINSTVGACAYVLDRYTAGTGSVEWIQLAAADNSTSTPKTWNVAAASHNTFINQYGNHRGKFELTADFSTGVMNGMHIKNDAHLQKLLKYYIASGKTETGVVLNLDGASATDKTFKISKLSIALLQTINKTTTKVTVQACASHNNPVKIIVTQDGQTELGLAAKKEVPNLDKVFAVATDVYLSKDCDWTWTGGTTGATAYKTPLTIDANVSSITNEGKLTVNAENVELSVSGKTLANAADATMDITKVTTVKSALTNLGTINVPAGAELRAYDVEIKNDATSLTDYGVINNAGVVGVTYATTGTVNNYGKIIMKNSDAITLLTSNQTAAGNFDNAFNAGTNKLGTVVLPAGQPNALVSVSNGAETGFIEYTWTGSTTYATPNGGIVKYNTLIVSDNIAFTAAENEIRFIKFEGVKKTVTNSTNANLPNLKGIIIKDNCSIIIEKSNTISCSEGSHLGNGAAVYNGGAFTPGNTNIAGKIVTDYLGTWNTDQIVVW